MRNRNKGKHHSRQAHIQHTSRHSSDNSEDHFGELSGPSTINLLHLPREIRFEILSYLLYPARSETITYGESSRPTVNYNLQLQVLRVNKQMLQDGCAVLYGRSLWFVFQPDCPDTHFMAETPYVIGGIVRTRCSPATIDQVRAGHVVTITVSERQWNNAHSDRIFLIASNHWTWFVGTLCDLFGRASTLHIDIGSNVSAAFVNTICDSARDLRFMSNVCVDGYLEDALRSRIITNLTDTSYTTSDDVARIQHVADQAERGLRNAVTRTPRPLKGKEREQIIAQRRYPELQSAIAECHRVYRLFKLMQLQTECMRTQTSPPDSIFNRLSQLKQEYAIRSTKTIFLGSFVYIVFRSLNRNRVVDAIEYAMASFSIYESIWQFYE